MLFHVTMTVKLPPDMPPERSAELKRVERARAQELQQAGKWRHLWRVAGRYANVSVFDVTDAAELNDIMMSLPLFPWMEVEVTALCRHPSAIREDDS
jgi:muconolactone D-isomerase